MASITDHQKWVQRGRQRRALAQVFLKPMTPTQIAAKARQLNPHIQLRDVWRLLGQFDQHKLAFCINPQHITGKLYFLTDLGRTVVHAAFGQKVAPLPTKVDWDAYARVVRAKVRRSIMLELAKSVEAGQAGKTTTEVRKNLLSDNPIGLNQTIRAVRELRQQKLIQDAGTTIEGARKRYQLTPLGRCVVEELKRLPDSGSAETT